MNFCCTKTFRHNTTISNIKTIIVAINTFFIFINNISLKFKFFHICIKTLLIENKYPILIDQPEDDLDNRAIYNDLVTYIRNKKLERQIILVTHNPNITVATDAEEIIVANQHGVHTENQDGIKFEYRSGSIENSYKRDSTDGYTFREAREPDGSSSSSLPYSPS